MCTYLLTFCEHLSLYIFSLKDLLCLDPSRFCDCARYTEQKFSYSNQQPFVREQSTLGCQCKPKRAQWSPLRTLGKNQYKSTQPRALGQIFILSAIYCNQQWAYNCWAALALGPVLTVAFCADPFAWFCLNWFVFTVKSLFCRRFPGCSWDFYQPQQRSFCFYSNPQTPRETDDHSFRISVLDLANFATSLLAGYCCLHPERPDYAVKFYCLVANVLLTLYCNYSASMLCFYAFSVKVSSSKPTRTCPWKESHV